MVDIDRELELKRGRTFSETDIRRITSKDDPYFVIGKIVPGKKSNGDWAWFRPIGEGPNRTFQFVIKATATEGQDLSDVSDHIVFETVQDGCYTVHPSWSTKGK